jgi:hypothetical protein
VKCGYFTSLEVLVVVSLAEALILQALDRATDIVGSICSDPVTFMGSLSKVVALFQHRLAWEKHSLCSLFGGY